MRYTFFILVSMVVLLLTNSSLIAQSEAEIEQYGKASVGSVRDCNKFLSKYPNSKHADGILFRRDSMMFHSIDDDNIKAYTSFFTKYPNSKFYSQAIAKVDKYNQSSITRVDAQRIFKETVSENVAKMPFSAVGVKYKGDEYIFAVVIIDSGFSLYKLETSSDTWEVASVDEQVRYNQFEELSSFGLRGEIEDVNVLGNKYVLFSYDNYSPNSIRNSPTIYQARPFFRESVTVLLDVKTDVLYSAMFSGVEQKTKRGVVVEGKSMDVEVNEMEEIPEMTYLLKYIDKQPLLKPITEGNLISDETVRWWYENNPKGSTLLEFGALPANSSIVSQYNRQKDIKKSKLYDTALFDFRGNTLIVMYQKSTKEYILLWSEPQAVNKDRDRLLNTVYFENPNVLSLFYYIGKKTDKKRLNISERRLY